MSGFLANLFGVGDEQARGDSLDAQLTEMNSRDYAPGGHVYNNIEQLYGTEAADNAYAVTQKDLQTSKTGDVDAQLWDAFDEGLSDGRKNIDSGIFNTLKTILGSVPVFVWIGIAAGIFLWLGGFAWLAKKGKGVLNR
jgi:hypothetical protein